MNRDPANAQKVAGGRFAYATGSKPLDGYTIKRGIGVGGFGEVYFAVSDAGKEVALKRIQRNLDVELRGVQNCLNLKNVNLIALWDIRTNNAGESWVVMEYVPGPSLRDIVEDHQTGMPQNQVQRWFCSTAAGVAYLHDQGIVHRDLKPANIFLDDDENVIKIGDYGLSKFISTSRRSGQTETVGTFHYMAPEIGKGIYGKEIDIYAMGIVLFEMLTGDVPFEGESSQEIIMKHLTANPNLDRVPGAFREPIRKALMKDPDDRFDTIQEFLEALPWGHPSDSEIASSYPETTYPKNVKPKTPPPPKTQDEVIDAEVVTEIGAAKIRVIGEGITFGQVRDSTAPGVRNEPAEEIRFIDPVDSLDSAAPEQPSFLVTDAAASYTSSKSVRPDEPIAKAVQSGWGRLAFWWNNTPISTPIRLGLLFVAGVVVMKNSEWLLPVGLGLGFLYLVYYAVRVWMLTPNEQSTAAKKSSRQSKREMKRRTIASVRTHLGQRNQMEKLSELIGSLLIAAVACLVFNLFGMAIGGSIFDSSLEAWAIYTWSTVVSLFASWSILCTSKFWEHKSGDPQLRHLTMMGLGFATGLVAFLTASALNVDLMSGVEPNSLSQLGIANIPLFPAYLIYFTVLFSVIRWWFKADPVRRTRLSVISVGLALVWAAVFSHTLEFAPVWNCILAVVVSAAIQLAALWIHPKRREAIDMDAKTVYDSGP